MQTSTRSSEAVALPTGPASQTEVEVAVAGVGGGGGEEPCGGADAAGSTRKVSLGLDGWIGYGQLDGMLFLGNDSILLVVFPCLILLCYFPEANITQASKFNFLCKHWEETLEIKLAVAYFACIAYYRGHSFFFLLIVPIY